MLGLLRSLKKRKMINEVISVCKLLLVNPALEVHLVKSSVFHCPKIENMASQHAMTQRRSSNLTNNHKERTE